MIKTPPAKWNASRPATCWQPTPTTDPDWEPVMKRASAICYQSGPDLPRGRSLPANWVSRRVVGCGDANRRTDQRHQVTVSVLPRRYRQIYEGKLALSGIESHSTRCRMRRPRS